ncbi:hypothetical protein SLS62_008555 [Diatrype stigma]|uniref:Oxidoreductase n=1 Tax=Diatrype stigma TaxID=117547 RepID=A0AAN9UI52_9PEZI
MAAPPRPPIRTAIIGLSASAATNWASHAHLPYLLSARGRSRFQIVALCNSSAEAARRAIAAHGLPPEPATRAYGAPEDLAADPDVQLVVCCTRVDRHYDAVAPSLRRGKHVYAEWPLAEDAARAAELAALARESGGRTVVGLQDRFAPVVRKVRELVESGRVGKVLSSEVRAAGGLNSRDVIPTGLRYFAERKVGGNVLTIGFGHLFEWLQFALGDLQDIESHLQIQRPDVPLRDAASGAIVETVRSDVPDLILVTGSLPASEHVRGGATVHARFRRGPAFKGEDPLVWTVAGEKGEIRLSASGGPSIGAMAHGDPLALEVHDFVTDAVESVEWAWPEAGEELPVMGRNVGALYEAFAAGDEAEYPTFDHAVKRHNQLEEILRKGFSTS